MIVNGETLRTSRTFGVLPALLVGIWCWGALGLAWGAESHTLPDVISVLPPGQGENLVDAGPFSGSLTAQLVRFDTLRRNLGSLSEAQLLQFYKPMDLQPVAPREILSVDTPIPGVRIVRDRLFSVPRVYGSTRSAAMFGVGYAQAQSLLWQMEVNRQTWYGRKASILGIGEHGKNLADDAVLFRVLDYTDAEYSAMFQRLKTGYGPWGRQAADDLSAYVAGINAYIELITKVRPDLMPSEIRSHGWQMRKWTPEDVIASSAYVHVRGIQRGLGLREGGNSVLLVRLRRLFGDSVADRIYADLRDVGDPETPSVIAGTSPQRQEPTNAPGVALVEPESLKARNALVMAPIPIPTAAARFIFQPPHNSNALLVDSTVSATGHPLSVQGPQDGYGFPHRYDLEIEIMAPDFEARGSLELHGPYPYNGARGRNYVVSGTAEYVDQFDLFAEVLCEPDGGKPTLASRYQLYRDHCVPLRIRDVTVNLPAEGGGYRLRSERSVHGPIVAYAEIDGKPVALAQARSTFFHEEAGLPAFARIFSPSVVRSARDFVNAMLRSPRQTAFFYVDRKDIAFVNPGLVPIRSKGMRTDLPVWGTGQWDWEDFDPQTYSFRSIPPSQLPWVVDPPDHVLAGWNNQPGEAWPLADNIWVGGPGHRVSLLKEPTTALIRKRMVTSADLVRIHTLAGLTDARAHFVYPLVSRVIEADAVPDRLVAAVRELDRWAEHGALRLESPEGGSLEHGGAIHLFDVWWPLLLRAEFSPVLGDQILDEAGGHPNNLSPLTTGPGDVSGWIGYASRDLRSLLGDDVPAAMSREYCGKGDFAVCRTAILASLQSAVTELIAKEGPDYLRKRYPIVCPQCIQTDFEVTGAAGQLEPVPWQNRPTLEIVTNFR